MIYGLALPREIDSEEEDRMTALFFPPQREI